MQYNQPRIKGRLMNLANAWEKWAENICYTWRPARNQDILLEEGGGVGGFSVTRPK